MGIESIVRKRIYKTDVKEARKKLKMTQKAFAEWIGVSKPTVERWESTDEEIRGLLPMLVEILMRHPELKDEFSIPESDYPVRMFYMFKDMICGTLTVE